MDYVELIAKISEYNLSIRRIPDKIVSCYEIRHMEEGDKIVHRYGREMVERTVIPGHAGKWMVKSVKNSDTMVRWNIKTDNLSDTLAGSISLFMEGLDDKY